MQTRRGVKFTVGSAEAAFGGKRHETVTLNKHDSKPGDLDLPIQTWLAGAPLHTHLLGAQSGDGGGEKTAGLGFLESVTTVFIVSRADTLRFPLLVKSSETPSPLKVQAALLHSLASLGLEVH